MPKRKPDLFADAMMPVKIVNKLRRLGYDVLTLQQFQGTSEPEEGLPDEIVLQVATTRRRAVITINAKDFRMLHWTQPHHQGIIICDETTDYSGRAKEIDEAIKEYTTLVGKMICVHARDETT